jgi:hypothetical protein
MYKNVAGQKLRVFAFDTSTNAPVTDDAANITCKVSKDNGGRVALEDTNPVETEDGYYLFDLTQAETNANTLDFYPDSSSVNTVVIVPNFSRQTVISFTGSGAPLDPSETGISSIINMARAILGDLDSTNYTYSDDRLRQVMSVAAICVYNSATFDTTYTINVNDWTITPDPANDNSFIILISYKMACLIAGYELKNDQSGFSMKDGPTTIDVTAGHKNKELTISNYCETYEKLLLDYLMYGGVTSSGMGEAILGPYSPGGDLLVHTDLNHRSRGWQ